MPAAPARTDNALSEFFQAVAWLDPEDPDDAEELVEQWQRLGQIRVEDAREAGWMVPEGQALEVRTASGSFLVEVSEIL